MRKKGKLFLTLFLIIWVIFSGLLFINHGQSYIGKSYFNSDYFQSTIESYKEQLGRYVLAPFDEEKAKKNITVTQEEIDYYRNYYGTLTEQIENIRGQYTDRILQAEHTGDNELKELLVAERDAKIEDIKGNFQNDEYVEKKIRNDKIRIIESYAAQQERDRNDFLNEYNYFAYSITNIKTGETVELGDLNGSNIYTNKFGYNEPYLTVDSTAYIDPYESNHTIDDMYNGFEVQGEIAQFEGIISVPKSMLNSANFKGEYQSFMVAKIIFYIIWATGILAIVGLLTFAKPSWKQFMISYKIKTMFLKLPVDVRIVSLLITAFIGIAFIDVVGNMIGNIYYNWAGNNFISYILEIIIYTVIVFIALTAVTFGAIWTFESMNGEIKWQKELKGAFLYKLANGIQDLFLNRSIGLQSVAILTIAFLAGIGLVGAFVDGVLTVIYLFLFFFIALPSFLIFLSRMGYLNRIMKQTKDMAEGRLTTEIKVKGKSPFARHAANLNALREGVKRSMSEQAKSERLKTELITNVSHDLRTPLTSIITYTDLLKNPNITEEERNQYIDVLDKKSARLKTLIEDLFEVSKMASGNIEITKQRIDLTQLMKQAIGEHEEEFSNAKLDLRLTIPDEPIFAYVDGQKWWRVIDNLVVNTIKYSLEGTRVYVTLKKRGAEAEFTVKNVSKYEMSENVEELTERFKRADASRHTDGSGLGLAIAQSIVDLHEGLLNIELDGDLFKVIVTVPTEY
ncbi:HAMP domain-containing sensor histidine kinase [Lysinibacillus telephonicus]|uniref:HAMP domain-containing sensor histidine kinase n=1 Tax=Lysinibacillus telephonicus TaxID=1714840 RepID=UPI0031FD4DDC